jgi:hypothetical protein
MSFMVLNFPVQPASTAKHNKNPGKFIATATTGHHNLQKVEAQMVEAQKRERTGTALHGEHKGVCKCR